jgi:hypothetical protein
VQPQARAVGVATGRRLASGDVREDMLLHPILPITEGTFELVPRLG